MAAAAASAVTPATTTSTAPPTPLATTGTAPPVTSAGSKPATNVMADLDSYAFQPGQQVQCKTRFDDVYKGEVVAFDLSSKILILKSPSSSGVPTNHDLNFLVLDSVSDVQILEEPVGAGSNDQLPNIEMKHIKAKQAAALDDRMRLIDAVGNGVSQEGIQLYSALSKKYDRASDIVWKDKVKIVVMNAVVINPPYTEADCQSLTPKTQKEAVAYVKSNVKKFWESCSKQQQAQRQSQNPATAKATTTPAATGAAAAPQPSAQK